MKKENCELCGQIMFPPLLDEYKEKIKNQIPKIKELYSPIDFHGKTFIVLTLCKEDLEPYVSKKFFKEMTDDNMGFIAEKLGDALMDSYWDTLSIVCDYYEKDFKK